MPSRSSVEVQARCSEDWTTNLTTLHKDLHRQFDVLVSQKQLSTMSTSNRNHAAQGRQSTATYTFSSEDKQAALVEAQCSCCENHDASQEEVNRNLRMS